MKVIFEYVLVIFAVMNTDQKPEIASPVEKSTGLVWDP